MITVCRAVVWCGAMYVHPSRTYVQPPLHMHTYMHVILIV